MNRFETVKDREQAACIYELQKENIRLLNEVQEMTRLSCTYQAENRELRQKNNFLEK